MSRVERLDLCFVHVPKTAGLSLLDAIIGSLGERDFVRGEVNHTVHRFARRPELQLTRIGHENRVPGCLTLAQYRRERVGPCFVFAFVRNPFDRLVSAFHFLHRSDLPPLDVLDKERYLARHGGDFDRFVRHAFDTERPAVLQQIHLRPQYQWLADDDGALLTDFVGRFENLSADMAAIAQRFGFAAAALPQLNVTEHLPWGRYYDDTTRALVARAYQRDFELFGYDPSEPGPTEHAHRSRNHGE